MADNTPKDTSLQSTKQMLDELDALMERMLSLPANEMEEVPALTREPVKGPTLAASLTLLEPDASAPPLPTLSSPSPPPQPLSISATPPATKNQPTVPKPAVPKPAVPKPASPASVLLTKSLDRRPKTTKLPPTSSKSPLGRGDATKIPTRPAKLDTLDELDIEKEVAAPGINPNPEPKPLTNDVVPPTVISNLDPALTEGPIPGDSSASTLALPLVWVNQSFDRVTLKLGFAGRWLRSNAGRTLLGFTGVALFIIAAGWVVKDWLGWNW